MKAALKNGLLRLGWITFVLAALSTTALAADNRSAEPANSTVGLVFRWLNFLLAFGGLAYLLARYGGGFFRGRAQSIAASIRESAAEKAAADQELRDAGQKVAQLDQEVAQMRHAGLEEAAAEAKRIAESGRREISRIEQASRVEIGAAERAARQELKSLAAGLAVDRAGALVRSRMDAGTRAALFQSFLSRLEGSLN
jgi:F0F1-type ATP synthase membrane subunit b/b'